MKSNLIYLLLLSLIASCGPTRNLAYFSDLQEQAVYKEEVANTTESKIQPDDLLSVSVTSLNPEANAVFNRGIIPPAGIVTDFGVGSRGANIHSEGYLVDQNGYIEYPVLGKVELGGLTKDEAKAKLAKALDEYLKDPIVTIRFLNYRVTVIGEVNRPSTFTIPSERINILEALGMAGDMTAFGRRENVLIIREENGVRSMTRVNLNNKEVLKSPYFYLQQNDVVYVEPDKMKQVQASTNTRTLSIITAVTSLAIVVASRLF
ncbi:polysaccharide biosynthesis/export family protein [Pontibacter korlensis]|uniref:Sugar transporter n=1 Tax=Pontibacter korlensis TaxID=400092 RepID=A0A0E3ZDX1_9BACT|nr:polysaccharide biosynthesis/export family protein [Pontibacter korlensis]AKD01939.1 sugar transporter [Pontibacter korlensis]